MHIITIEIFSQDYCKSICYCCKDICCGCLYNNNKKSEKEELKKEEEKELEEESKLTKEQEQYFNNIFTFSTFYESLYFIFPCKR